MRRCLVDAPQTDGLDGEFMHELARTLFPITRSITGDGVRSTLAIIKKYLPGLTVHSVPSGTPCFDWTVPDEWRFRDAYLVGPDGTKVVDAATNNLHVVNYSTPTDCKLSLAELQDHLHSRPDLPNAIPYVTSYYQRNWGFCLSQNQRDALTEGSYRAVIDSEHFAGELNYGELVLRGATDREVFLSTYVCHPSMANNELSGPVVATRLAQRLADFKNHRYTYRFVFIPETIGSIVYLSQHLEHLRSKVIAGFNLTCVGDERAWSYLPSRHGDTLADRAALHVLGHSHPEFNRYSFLDRGSDERQYCAPGVDLPIASIMRSKYGTYPEYHTSLDDLDLITPIGLQESLDMLWECLTVIEVNDRCRSTILGEPQMGRRGLYPTTGHRPRTGSIKEMMDVLAYCDNQLTVLEIADLLKLHCIKVHAYIRQLEEHGIVITEHGTAGDRLT